MKKLCSILILCWFALPAVALAQEAGDVLLSREWDIGLTLYELLGSVLTAGLLWLKLRLSTLIKAKTKNTILAGILSRLNESVFDAVKAVNEQMYELIDKAKDPATPGGVRITIQEAYVLKSAALAHIKAYWGPKGLKELALVLGFGGLFGLNPDEPGLERLLTDKIEAAVNDVKMDARAAVNPKTPIDLLD